MKSRKYHIVMCMEFCRDGAVNKGTEVNLRIFWARQCGAAFRLLLGQGVLCSLREKHEWAIPALGFSCS